MNKEELKTFLKKLHLGFIRTKDYYESQHEKGELSDEEFTTKRTDLITAQHEILKMYENEPKN